MPSSGTLRRVALVKTDVTFLRNVSSFKSCKAYHPRRRHSSIPISGCWQNLGSIHIHISGSRIAECVLQLQRRVGHGFRSRDRIYTSSGADERMRNSPYYSFSDHAKRLSCLHSVTCPRREERKGEIKNREEAISEPQKLSDPPDRRSYIRLTTLAAIIL
jgi:hypothetical protein